MRVYGILADYPDQNDPDRLRSDPLFKIVCDRSIGDPDLAASRPCHGSRTPSTFGRSFVCKSCSINSSLRSTNHRVSSYTLLVHMRRLVADPPAAEPQQELPIEALPASASSPAQPSPRARSSWRGSRLHLANPSDQSGRLHHGDFTSDCRSPLIELALPRPLSSRQPASLGGGFSQDQLIAAQSRLPQAFQVVTFEPGEKVALSAHRHRDRHQADFAAPRQPPTPTRQYLESHPRNKKDLNRFKNRSCRMRLSGLEPETYGLKVRCSTD
jgi:hypothetical protein